MFLRFSGYYRRNNSLRCLGRRLLGWTQRGKFCEYLLVPRMGELHEIVYLPGETQLVVSAVNGRAEVHVEHGKERRALWDGSLDDCPNLGRSDTVLPIRILSDEGLVHAELSFGF